MTLARSSKRTTNTMAEEQQPNSYPNFNPYDPEQNGMNEYERNTDEWNQSNQVQEMRMRRSAAINNTTAYYTGGRIHHLRTIQMPEYTLWNDLFGYENLNQSLLAYAQASLDSVTDQTNTLRFAGQMEVAMLMQENFRPGVHLAIFVVYLTPHRQFRDGHLVQMEFGEGSHTHCTVSNMFGLDSGYAIVTQATELQLLEFLADDDDAMELLHGCFLQPDFAPMRFAFVQPVLPHDDDDAGGYYIQNRNAGNHHRWHELGDQHPPNVIADVEHGGVADADDDADDDDDEVIAIPPPNPVNDFAEIYQAELRRHQDANYNIIPYDDDDDDDDDDNNAQG
jgi:hypothetical protein